MPRGGHGHTILREIFRICGVCVCVCVCVYVCVSVYMMQVGGVVGKKLKLFFGGGGGGGGGFSWLCIVFGVVQTTATDMI